MRPSPFCRLVTGTVALVVAAAPLLSAELAPWAPPYADPLRLASLPLEMADGLALARGEWTISVSPGYFNLWAGSWHTATIHKELGLVGRPLTSAELRTLEARHPGDDIYRFDLEGTLTEVRFARGLGRGLTLSLGVPWLEIGRPHWDAISADFHAVVGVSRGGRNLFARGQTLAYVWSPRQHRAIEAWDSLNGGALGDVRLTLSGSLGGLAGGEHRWVVALEAPTGKQGTLAGSGGWDVGVRWFGAWAGPRSLLQCALGYTRLDPAGSFLGARRDDTWHALADYRHAWGERTEVLLAARWDTSPLASFSRGEPGRPASFVTVGASRRLGERVFVAAIFGENLTPAGVSPDYTIQLQLGVHGGPRLH